MLRALATAVSGRLCALQRDQNSYESTTFRKEDVRRLPRHSS
jgi:hypothetical protein